MSEKPNRTRDLLLATSDLSVSWAHMSTGDHLDAAQRAVASLAEHWTTGYWTITPLQLEVAKLHVAAAQVRAAVEGGGGSGA